ncbi:MAG TPA: hypothetical protein VHQ65_12645 [Thermoanaerobaculia bacterium]|nr:hypothetical protein [Thermoanaerobaculia bacterium]
MKDVHRFPAHSADGLAGRRQYLRFLYTQQAVNDSELLRRQIQALESELGAAEVGPLARGRAG